MVKVVSNVDPNSLLQSNGASPIKPSGVIAAGSTITTGVWNGSSISTTFTDAKIKTVTGTTNRLTIGGTATDPTFDISTSYVGQATITTLGTIGTGTWQGTKIGTLYGGTNADSSGSSGVVSVNAGTWTFNNVLTTNRLLIAAAGNTVTSNANLTYDGTSFVVGTTGPHSIGGGTFTSVGLRINTTSATNAGGFSAVATVGGTTAVTADSGSVHVFDSMGADQHTVNTGGHTVTNYDGISVAGTNLLKAGGGTITNAASIRISDAPTVATNNYALWSVSGTNKMDGGLIMGAPTGGDKGSGTINVAADIYKNNGVYTNPDYVFHEYFRDRV